MNNLCCIYECTRRLLVSDSSVTLYNFHSRRTNKVFTCNFSLILSLHENRNINFSYKSRRQSIVGLSLVPTRISFSFPNNREQSAIFEERPRVQQVVNINTAWATKVDWICEHLVIAKFVVHTYIGRKL